MAALRTELSTLSGQLGSAASADTECDSCRGGATSLSRSRVEQRLAQLDLIKQLRVELIEHGRQLLEDGVQGILGVRVLSLHTDISTRTGESVIVFTLATDPLEKSRAGG